MKLVTCKCGHKNHPNLGQNISHADWRIICCRGCHRPLHLTKFDNGFILDIDVVGRIHIHSGPSSKPTKKEKYSIDGRWRPNFSTGMLVEIIEDKATIGKVVKYGDGPFSSSTKSLEVHTDTHIYKFWWDTSGDCWTKEEI